MSKDRQILVGIGNRKKLKKKKKLMLKLANKNDVLL